MVVWQSAHPGMAAQDDDTDLLKYLPYIIFKTGTQNKGFEKADQRTLDLFCLPHFRLMTNFELFIPWWLENRAVRATISFMRQGPYKGGYRALYRNYFLQGPYHTISQCTTLYYTILYYTILYYTILYYTILYYTILYYTLLYYTILYNAILYYILYYSILFYTILYYTIQYYTILYYTILYYTILYYTILFYSIL